MPGKPLIGITCGLRLESEIPQFFDILPARYVRAVWAAGGVPLAVPVMDPADVPEVLRRVDGIVVSGGPDIPPKFYGEAENGCKKIVPDERVESDMAVARHCRDTGLPYLAICYGHQVAHVAYGARLVQDIPTQVPDAIRHHRDEGSQVLPRHEVRLSPGSRLAELLAAETLSPVSAHHQAVRDCAPGLVPVGWSPDGVLEAAEDPDHPFFFTVQWHPEISPDEDHAKRLFEGIVRASGGWF